jgi:hypothetical protein
MISILFSFIPIILIIIFIVIRFNKRNRVGTSDDNQVKRFFQYSLLFGLIVIVAIGLAGLIAKILSQSSFVISDQAALARNISFVLVGLPILIGIGSWIRKQHQAKTSEKNSLAWGAYLTLILTTSLLVSVTAANEVLRWIFQLDDYSSSAIAQLIVWGLIWIIHFRLAKDYASQERLQTQYLIGSFVGLMLGIVGLSSLISNAISALTFDTKSYLIGTNFEALLSGAISLILAVVVWFIYWIKTSLNSERSLIWNIYVLVIVVGGSLITAVSTLSTFFYRVLVWFIGNPIESTATLHFKNSPTLFAVTISMLLVWWYHRNILSSSAKSKRTEVDRTYDYLIAGIGLIAAGAGFTGVLVALIESFASPALLPGRSAINTLLGAITLLIVGAPVWLIHWSRVQKKTKEVNSGEVNSQVRRVYLFLLFGIGGIAAIISLITAVYFLLEDILLGEVSIETLREMRYPLSILISTALIANYHWLIFKSERENIIKGYIGPKVIYLISPPDEELANWMKENTRANFKIWFDTETSNEVFSRSELKAVIESTATDTAFILRESGKIKSIKVEN